MVFSSLTFLYYFLPVLIIVYVVAPKRLKNVVLLVSSIIFYAWGEPRYLMLLAISICTGYVFGLLAKRYFCATIFAVIINLGILGYFKYADFFIGSFNFLTGLSVPLLKVTLPIGISFYTFQVLSYVIDVRRGRVEPEKSLIKLATYIASFPQMIAGPIVRYEDIKAQLKDRGYDLSQVSYGIRRFVIGLCKKVIIANTLGVIVGSFQSASEKDVLYVWIYALSLTLQIYFDFSGYSDMAIGLGKMLGFDFPENFDYPLMSQSVTEFWKRWHMTLGSWFRDYLYIPLGGNRVGKMRHIINILIVWMATGLWHGASWNFVAWGLYFAILLIIEKKIFGKYLAKLSWISHIYLILLIMVSFVIFDGSSLEQSVVSLKIMFGMGNVPIVSNKSLFVLKNYFIVFLVAIVGATAMPKRIANRLKAGNDLNVVIILDVLEPVMIAIGILICTAFLVNDSFNPFLYFRF